MERLTDEQLAEIRKRADAATMGDWDYDVVDHVISNGNFMVAMAELDSEGYPVIYAKEADLDFITNAREDVPKLLKEIERLKRFERLVNGPVTIVAKKDGGTEVKFTGVTLDITKEENK